MITLLYRLFTQNLNYEQVKKLVCEYFDGCTMIKADGVWQGESEHSLIIEIDDQYKCWEKIERLCFAIKKLNEQDKILVQRIESDSRLV